MRNKRNIKNLGFSLLELSVIILVISIIGVVGVTFQVSMLNNSHNNKTIDKISKIEEAINRYFLENRRLPCPADITLETTSPNYGLEKIDASSEECNLSTDFLSNNIFYGAVPTKALNLSNNYGLDGWRNNIVYVVDENYTKTDSFLNSDTGNIKIINLNEKTITNNAIYFIFSPGENKNGAFVSGNELSINISLKDSENVYSSGFDNIFIKDIVEDDFDDISTYKEKEDLILFGNLEDTPCSLITLSNIDSGWDYDTHTKCPNGICQHGVEINSSSTCAQGYISENPNIYTADNTYRPIKKCLKYGKWSDTIYPCVLGCGESNIVDVIGGNFTTSGELSSSIDLKYLNKAALNEEMIVQCSQNNMDGYINLKCLPNGNWEYVSGRCYSKTTAVYSVLINSNGGIDNPEISLECNNSDLSSNSYNFDFVGTGETTEYGVQIPGSCINGANLYTGGSTPIATCTTGGVWEYSGGPCYKYCTDTDVNTNDYYFTFSNVVSGNTSEHGETIGSGECLSGYVLSYIGGYYYELVATCNDGAWKYNTDQVVCGSGCLNSLINTNDYNFVFSANENKTTAPNTEIAGECADGYSKPVGSYTNVIAKCTGDYWSYNDDEISCLKACDNSTINTNDLNFTFKDTSGTTDIGSIVYNGECSDGYVKVGTGNINATCEGNDVWSYTDVVCTLPCENSIINNNDLHFTFKDTNGATDIGVTLYGGCEDGYNQITYSNVTATCQENGTWSYNSGSECVADCQNIELENNDLHFTFKDNKGTTNIGATIWNGECADGYVQVGTGNINATCEEGAVWNYSDVVCTLPCENSTINKNDYHYVFDVNEKKTTNIGVVVYDGYCADGYTRNTSSGFVNIVAECLIDGTWSYSGNPCE